MDFGAGVCHYRYVPLSHLGNIVLRIETTTLTQAHIEINALCLGWLSSHPIFLTILMSVVVFFFSYQNIK